MFIHQVIPRVKWDFASTIGPGRFSFRPARWERV